MPRPDAERPAGGRTPRPAYADKAQTGTEALSAKNLAQRAVDELTKGAPPKVVTATALVGILAALTEEPEPVAAAPDDPDYSPLWAERRCTRCGYWRGQHVLIGDLANDTDMHCPVNTTFQPSCPSSAADWNTIAGRL